MWFTVLRRKLLKTFGTLETGINWDCPGKTIYMAMLSGNQWIFWNSLNTVFVLVCALRDQARISRAYTTFKCVYFQRSGLPTWLGGKQPTCQCRRHKKHRFDPCVGKIPRSRKWQPTLVFLPEKSHGQRSLADYSPWGCKKVGHNLVNKQ